MHTLSTHHIPNSCMVYMWVEQNLVINFTVEWPSHKIKPSGGYDGTTLMTLKIEQRTS